MSKRAEYYASLPMYYKLEELRTLILQKKPAEDILAYIKEHRISVNSYVKGIRPNEWIPLLHLCCRYDELQPVVKYIIKNGANIHLAADADEREPLLLSCNMLYLRFLIEHGCNMESTPALLKRRLRCADTKRLKILVKTGKLTVHDIISCDADPILYSVTSMKEYLLYAFNIRQDIKNLTEELRCTIERFLELVKQLVIWYAPVTEASFKFCVDHYLYEFITEFRAHALNLKCEYHEYKDKLQVAILRPLLNDSRYEMTCKVLNQEPCKELYEPIKI